MRRGWAVRLTGVSPFSDTIEQSGRKTWSVIETALPRLFELRSFSLVGIALVPPKGQAHASIHVPLQTLVLRQQGRSNLQNRLGVLQQPRLLGPLDPVVELFDQ